MRSPSRTNVVDKAVEMAESLAGLPVDVFSLTNNSCVSLR
jgi:hypothetical protein